jgi:hypothetical protein
MKANKYIINITVEVLSPDSAGALFLQMADQYQQEFRSGSLTADDGDSIVWETAIVPVKF